MFNKMLGIAIALVIAISFIYANVAKAQVVTDGLVSYWTFDETNIEGDTVKDVWGNNDGTMMGDTHMVEGEIGQALEFDGDGDYVEIANEPAFDIYDALSVSIWVKVVDGWNIDWQIFITKGGDVSWEIRRHAGTNKITWTLNNFNVPDFVDTEDANVHDGEWHHLLGVYDGSMGRLYIDGQLYTEMDAPAVLDSSDAPVAIGARIWDVVGKVDAYHRGLIDEVGIYNRALTENEVVQNFAANTGPTAVSPADKLSITWGEIRISK